MALSGSLNFLSSSYFTNLIGTTYPGMPNTFVPLNIWTNDTIAGDTNTLGLPDSTELQDYGLGASAATSVPGPGPSITGLLDRNYIFHNLHF